MSASYTTEPPPTATVLLHTTAGPLTISLFAQQTPLTCRNFLQHCLDGTYDGTLFHRVAPGFVIQTGDPTGTGEGGENIYDNDDEFGTYDAAWARVMGREKGEKIKFGDEVHSRLKFNRRGLVGMANSEGAGGGYGTQFFITLGDVRAELDGKCTMFGRVEGDGIYNVVKVAEGELVEGTERPVFPEKIQQVEVLEMPKGEAWTALRARQRIAKRVVEEAPKKEKLKKKKAGKALLSFGGDDSEDVGVAVRPKKAKFNTALIDGPSIEDSKPKANGIESKKHRSPPPAKRKEPSPSPVVPSKRKASSPSLSKTSSPTHHRSPSFHDSTTQLPLRNEESPSNSPSPSPSPQRASATASKSKLESEIAALKESMRRPTAALTTQSSHKKSALESLIPATSTRGRKRPRPGDTLKDDSTALKMLNAFRARLDSSDSKEPSTEAVNGTKSKGKSRAVDSDASINNMSRTSNNVEASAAAEEDEEAHLCDLHFIANCQSCTAYSKTHPKAHLDNATSTNPDSDDDADFMHHSLSFAKDRLGKDLEWRKNMRNLKQEDMGEMGVIDVKEKEREIKERERGKNRGKEKVKGAWR